MPLLERNPHIDRIAQADSEDFPTHAFDWAFGLDEDEAACRLTSALKPRRIIGAYQNPEGKLTYTPDSRAWFDLGLLNRDADGSLTTNRS